MKHLLIGFILLAFASGLFAQPEVLWTSTFGGGQGDQGLAIIQAADGSIVAVGNEGSFGGGGADGWIVVIGDDGNEIWSANYGGNAYDRFYDVLQIDDGFVAGGYGGSFGAGQFDFWLLKMGEEGNQVWSRAFGGRDFERGTNMTRTADGGYALTGNTLSFGAGGSDGWLVVTDEDGQQDWTATFGGNNEDMLSGIVSLDDGGFVIGARTNSFGAGGYDFWLIRIDDEGDEVWSETYGGEQDDQCMSMIQTDDGGYILAGTTLSFAEESGDVWLVKTDENGEEVWSRNYDHGGNEFCRSVIQTRDGGYLLAGHTWPYDDARSDVWLVRTDDEGEELWSETYGGNQSDVGVDIVQTDDGGYALTGWTSSFGAGDLDMWVVRLGPEPAGVLQGYVLNAEDDAPIEGAIVFTNHGLFAETDDEGFFQIDPAWAGDFDMTASKWGYNDQTLEDLNIGEEDVLEVIFRLTHPEFEPSRDNFRDELEPDESTEFNFTITNEGNGPLNYNVERRLIGDADVDPWELRQAYNLEEAVGDNQLNGVVFVDDHYYVSGGCSGQQVNMIYVFDIEGNPVREFEQFHESRYGMRDLTWDGTLIWGSDVTNDGNILYGFTVNGDLEEEINGGAELYRSMTWDPDRSCFWSADITSNIWATDLNGDVVATINRPADLLTYGLAYWSDDPDDYQLYNFSRGDENLIDVDKINLRDGDAMLAATVSLDDGGRPGGIFITNQLDIYSWVLIGMVQNPERLAIWQLEARREWFQVEPTVGVIEAEDTRNFTLTLDATGLPTDNTFEGEIVFVHNAFEGETALSVTLDVVEGEVFTSRELNLHIGWNMVSVNLQPEPEDVEVLMADLVENGLLEMMKNDAGQFYLPDLNFNNIPGWFVDQGYQIKMRGAEVLLLEGMSVFSDAPIQLYDGWQLISYYPRRPVEAVIALSGIVDHLVIAKDGFGNFYIPAWNFSNMGEMRPGQGYYLNVDEDVVLIYRTERQEEEAAVVRGYSSVYSEPGLLPVRQVTGSNMSMLVLRESPLTPPLRSKEGIKGGVEIGIYTSGNLVGSGVLQDNVCGIAIWGDDPTTDEIDGALEGDRLEIRLLDDNGLKAAGYEVLAGEAVYRTDGFTVIRLTDGIEVPEDFAIISAYPNPFNSQMTITYSLPTAADVELKLFDLTGREITTLVSGNKQPGVHTATLTATDLPSGLYFVQLNHTPLIKGGARGDSQTRKVMLIR